MKSSFPLLLSYIERWKDKKHTGNVESDFMLLTFRIKSEGFEKEGEGLMFRFSAFSFQCILENDSWKHLEAVQQAQ